MRIVFIIITFINIILIFLMRILVKRNIFLKTLAFLTFFFQILTVLVGLIRERRFDLAPHLFTLLILCFSLISFFVLPLILSKVLSEEKKQNLEEIEETVKSFLLMTYDNFLDNKPRLSDFFFGLAKRLTKTIEKIVFSKVHFWIILAPWITFAFLFIFETIFTKQFLLAPYALAYYFLSYRIFFFLLYISKNTIAFLTNSVLRGALGFRMFQDLDILLEIAVLKDLVLEKKFTSKNEKTETWANFNQFLVFFVKYFIIKNAYYIHLIELKKILDTLNFSLAVSALISFATNDNGILFLLNFLSLGFFFINKWETKEKEMLEILFGNFISNLREFLSHFKYVLLTDHAFEVDDLHPVVENDIPLTHPGNSKDFAMPIFKALFLGLLPILTVFWIFPGAFYWIFSFISINEPLLFLSLYFKIS